MQNRRINEHCEIHIERLEMEACCSGRSTGHVFFLGNVYNKPPCVPAVPPSAYTAVRHTVVVETAI